MEDSRDIKLKGEELLKKGNYLDAISVLEKACCQSGFDDLALVNMLIDACMASQNKECALKYLEKALAIDPKHTANLLKYSALKLSGPNYLDVLKAAHSQIKPDLYIEIGVCKGKSFALANPETFSIGIDPEPQLALDQLADNQKVVSLPSDDYFSSDAVVNDFQEKTFDMAFLDGMHLFEYALRDFINLEKYALSNSVVFVHDVYPMNAETATRERQSDFWSGDVWKLILCLKKYRLDLNLEVLPCPPTGLGVITQLDKNSSVLEDNYQQILDEYVDMDYNVLEGNKDELLLLSDSSSLWINRIHS